MQIKDLELQGERLKMMTNRNYNVDLAKLSHKKLMFEFAKEKYFNEKALVKKNVRDKSLIGLLQPHAIMAGSLIKKLFLKPIEGKTKFLSSNPIEHFNRLKLLLHEKQSENISYQIKGKLSGKADNLMEHKKNLRKAFKLA